MNENNNKIEMNSNERNIGAVDNIIRITNPEYNLESHNYVALTNNNNNFDNESKTPNFNINDTKLQNNLYTYFNFTKEQIEKLNLKIISDGKRILLKSAYVLWTTYFFIISVSLLYFIFV